MNVLHISPEIAEALDIPRKTVYSRLGRAMDALRAALERLELAWHDGVAASVEDPAAGATVLSGGAFAGSGRSLRGCAFAHVAGREDAGPAGFAPAVHHGIETVLGRIPPVVAAELPPPS